MNAWRFRFIALDLSWNCLSRPLIHERDVGEKYRGLMRFYGEAIDRREWVRRTRRHHQGTAMIYPIHRAIKASALTLSLAASLATPCAYGGLSDVAGQPVHQAAAKEDFNACLPAEFKMPVSDILPIAPVDFPFPVGETSREVHLYRVAETADQAQRYVSWPICPS